MFVPVLTPTNDVHGPLALVETCLSSATPGLGALTVKVFEAVFPVPPLVEATAPLVLAYVPTLAAVTLTVTVHDPPADTVPPLRLTLPPFAAAMTVPPEQVVAPPGVPVFCKPAGYISENATPVRALFRFGFVIVKVSVDVPPARIGFGAKTFEMLGGCKTVKEAEATPVEPVFVPPSVEET